MSTSDLAGSALAYLSAPGHGAERLGRRKGHVAYGTLTFKDDGSCGRGPAAGSPTTRRVDGRLQPSPIAHSTSPGPVGGRDDRDQ